MGINKKGKTQTLYQQMKSQGYKWDFGRRRWIKPDENNKVSKYHSVKQDYAGRKYDSGLEARCAMYIDWLRVAGEITDVQYQKTYWLYGKNGHKICEHKVDFIVTMKDGHIEAWEAKGFETREWQIKRLLFVDNYPEIPYVVKRYADLPYVEPIRRG